MSDLGGFSMWELFRTETAAQMDTFTASLLAVEANDDSAAALEAAMRAAHSIKGAARIVQFDAGVRLAHVMEDCLVAAQNGDLTLTGVGIDVLLGAADLLARVAAIAEDEVVEWAQREEPLLEGLLNQLEQLRTGSLPASDPAAPTAGGDALAAGASVPPAPIEAAGATQQKPAGQESAAAGQDRALRVSAPTLNRLLALASESLVQSRWFEGVSAELAGLKRAQDALVAELERAGEATPSTTLARTQALEVRQQLAAHQHELEQFGLRAADLAERLYQQTLATRMRPFRDGIEAFPRLVRDLARELGKQVRLEIAGADTPVDRDILAQLEAPLNHIVRNCLDHGLELPDTRQSGGKAPTGKLMISARHKAGLLAVTVADDGRGIDFPGLRRRIVERELTNPEMAAALSEAELAEFLFLPGFSTAREVTELSGRGVGLDAVQQMVQSVGGSVRISAVAGQGTSFTLELPLTLSVVRQLIVSVGGEPWAFPLTRVARLVVVPRAELQLLEQQQFFDLEGERIGIVPAHVLLGLDSDPDWQEHVPVLLLGDRTNRVGLAVDGFLGEQDVVVRPLDGRLGRIPGVSAATILEDGEPALILDVEDLVLSVQAQLQEGRLRNLGDRQGKVASGRQRILVVEDSITVRELEKVMLEERGYSVDVAVDGIDGWNALRTAQYDLLITDIDMPRMTGLELLARVRADAKLAELPAIVVSYKDRDSDRISGMEAGANRYMTKNSFHDDSLFEAVVDLIGPAA